MIEIKELDLNGKNAVYADGLLQYVWKVADKFMPGFDPEWGQEPSNAPAQFVNRLSLGVVEGQGEMLRRYSDEQIQNTVRAYGLDPSKLWYLLLFVRDYIGGFEDAPRSGKHLYDELCELNCALEETSQIVLKKENGRVGFKSDRKEIIALLRMAMESYTMRYNVACDLRDKSREMCDRAEDCEDEEKAKVLRAKAVAMADRADRIFAELGLEGPMANIAWVKLDDTCSVKKSYRQWRFAEIMLWFLSDKKGVQPEGVQVKVYKERHFFVSMMLYVCGIYEEEDEEPHSKWYEPLYNDKENRNLSLLVSRYKDREWPNVSNGRYYN